MYNYLEHYYGFLDDKLTITKTTKKEFSTLFLPQMTHGSRYICKKKPLLFNRATRRLNSMLLMGDLPRIAFAKVKASAMIDPPILKLGELTIFIDGICLENADIVNTKFTPSGGVWNICLNDISIEFQADLIAKDLIVGEISLSKIATISCNYGKFEIGQRNFDASYISRDSVKVKSYVKNEANNTVSFSENDNYEAIKQETVFLQYFSDNIDFEIIDDTANAFVKSDKLVFVIKAQNINYTINQVFDERNKGREYFQNLINSAESLIPNDIMSLAYKHGILNHDYLYDGTAWYEGGHWWNCYWTNNFQISAATALGQFDRAKKALMFFGTLKNGYSCVMANGEIEQLNDFSGNSKKPLAYDGIPYYIYELYEYIEATGDFQTAELVFDNIKNQLDYLIYARDLTHSGMIGWKQGCNAFMYQADSLSLPGAATSPTIMIYSGLKMLGELAKKIGRTTESCDLLARAKEMKQKFDTILYDEENGCFYSHIDTQNKKHSSHYYTDYIFPILYGECDELTAFKSLTNLKDSLIFKSENGDTLMRVGELKPSFFGNDNVMPTQMAETARALFKTGDNAIAVNLLESIAKASTIFTLSPGSFPERMSDEGRGEFNYMFGNPCASYVYTYINGLFGIKLIDGGKKLFLSSAFPYEWKEASVCLPYLKFDFNKIGNEYKYKLESKKITALKFSVVFPFLKTASVYVGGNKVNADFSSEPLGTRVSFDICIDKITEVVIKLDVLEKQPTKPLINKVKTSINFLCEYKNGLNFNVFGSLPTINERTAILKLNFHTPIGIIHTEKTIELNERKEFFTQITLRQEPLFSIFTEYEIFSDDKKIYSSWQNVVVNIKEDCSYDYLLGKEKNIDIDDILTFDSMTVICSWRKSDNYPIKFREILQNNIVATTAGNFKVKFDQRADRVNCALIGSGFSDAESQLVVVPKYNNDVLIPINERVTNIGLLFVSEIASRLSSSLCGQIILHFSDKSDQIFPLIGGETLGSLVYNYANNVNAKKLLIGMENNDYAEVLWLGTPANKELASIEISMETYDSQIALLAINII